MHPQLFSPLFLLSPPSRWHHTPRVVARAGGLESLATLSVPTATIPQGFLQVCLSFRRGPGLHGGKSRRRGSTSGKLDEAFSVLHMSGPGG